MPKGNRMTHFYAHGGHVGADSRKRDALRHRSDLQHEPKHHNSPAHLRYFSEELRRKGHRGDKILAHINPQEAMELALLHGGDINPQTGLPQFGLFDNFNIKDLLPAAGGIIGSILFPPLAPGLLPASLSALGGAAVGGALGGTLGGALRNPEAPFQGTLQGLGAGAGAHFLGPMLGFGAKGAIPYMGGSAGRAAAFNALKTAAQVPAPAAAGMFGGSATPFLAGSALSSMGGGQQPQQPQQPMVQHAQQPQQPGLMGALGRGIRGMGQNIMENPLQSALLGTALYGAIHEGNRARKHKERTPHELMNEMNPYGPDNYKRSRKKARRMIRPGEEGYGERYYENVYSEPEYYARGGYVKDGALRGKDGGQSDKIPKKLKPDDYIMDATTVSLAGDGNTEAGFNRIKKDLLGNFEKDGIIKDYPHSHKMKAIDARVSPGEMHIDRKYLYAAGNGDPKKGAQVFDRFRNNLRKHKGVKKFLPPKSKPLTAYMR